MSYGQTFMKHIVLITLRYLGDVVLSFMVDRRCVGFE